MSPLKHAKTREDLRRQVIQNLQRFEELSNKSHTDIRNAFCDDWIHMAKPEDCARCELGRRIGGNCFSTPIGRYAAKDLAWLLNLSPAESEVDVVDGQTGEYIRENVAFFGHWLKELDSGLR